MDASDQTESENPYASPESVETRDGYVHVYGPERGRMPAAVMWVLGYSICAMVGWIVVAWNALGGDLALDDYVRIGFGVGSFLIAIVGTLYRNLLVYRFMRSVIVVFTLLLPILPGVVAWQIVTERVDVNTDHVANLYLAIGAASVVTVVMLHRKSTKAYFGLKCPECGAVRGVQANFLQTRVWCKKCRVTW